MRILYFSRDYTPHDYRFLKALGKTEHQIGYLRLERRGHPLEDRELPEGIDLIPWVGGKEPARFQDGLRLLIGLLGAIRAYNPDLIHAGPIQRAAFLTALAGFRPLVSMSWGYDLLIDASRNRWWTWATRFTLKRSAAMVGDCDTVRSLAVSYGMEADRIITFPWGIDLEHFKPIAERPQTGDEHAAESSLRKQLEWDKDKFVLLSTRSWSSLYGVEDLAHAFVRAAHQHPELRLLILGDGPLAP
ncbi:MAG: glycosyltransferase, partial [Chloroflexota bacterium]